MDTYQRARVLIDQAHAADPQPGPDGRPAELVYADRMEGWLLRLVPDPPPHLRLAARAQHLERWKVPRTTYPEGRAGYLAWRKTLYVRQADRARELLLAAGMNAAEADEAAVWISKTGLKTNAGTQALEDAACLVFLESELTAFRAAHPDASEDKLLGILGKVWNKMSPDARRLATEHRLVPGPVARPV